MKIGKNFTKNITLFVLIGCSIWGLLSCQSKISNKDADIYVVLWGSSFIEFGTQVVGLDSKEAVLVSKITVSDKIGEITQDNEYLWLSAPAGKNERFGKNVYRYDLLNKSVEKVIKTKGFAPNKIFVVDQLVFVSMYISDVDVRPFNSSIEVYKINRDKSLSFVKSIYLDVGARFTGDLISVSPSRDYIYIASDTVTQYNEDIEEVPILYVIHTKNLGSVLKINLVNYFGSAGGIAVSDDSIYISALQKYPGNPGVEEIEKFKDNRVLVFDRKTLKLINEIKLSNYVPDQVIYNKYRNQLYVLHNFRSTQAIAVVDCATQREVAVIDEIGNLSDMALVDKNTLLVTAKQKEEKRLVFIDLMTYRVVRSILGNYGAISYKNELHFED